jgi:hypothetical protein
VAAAAVEEEASTNNPEPVVPERREPMSQRVEEVVVRGEVGDPSGKAKLADPDGVEIDPPPPFFSEFFLKTRPTHFVFFVTATTTKKLYVNKIIRQNDTTNLKKKQIFWTEKF